MYACRVIPFPATHRSVLERIRSPDAELRRVAFGDLAAGYWKPSYHYLRLQWHLSPEEAEDAVQGFFTVAFEKHYVERYDPTHARFRTFLRMCLDRFVQNLRKSEAAGKRGGGVRILSLDFPDAEQEFAGMAASVPADADRFFHDETVRFLFARALASLRESFTHQGRDIVFEVFMRHDVSPSRDATYASIAADLGVTVSQVTNYLFAARRRFRELALSHLRAIAATDEEFRQEARELFGIESA
jgi:DNA-directed RNA polymerase specialized sigma24 family protein